MKMVKDDDLEEHEDSNWWHDGMWDFLTFLVGAIALVLIVYFGSK